MGLGRRGVQLGLAGLVTAGAVVAVVGIGGSGSAVSTATATAATGIATARRALVPAPGSVLDDQIAVQKAADAPVTQVTDDPSTGDEIVVTTQNGQPAVTTATESDTREFFDPANNSIARVAHPTPGETQSPTGARTYAEDLDRPRAQFDEKASYDASLPRRSAGLRSTKAPTPTTATRLLPTHRDALERTRHGRWRHHHLVEALPRAGRSLVSVASRCA